MAAYYNEHDLYAAQWLRNLIAAGHIAPGDVDERSIEDVRPSDLAGYVQCHFFAGIGVWSYALRRAGWPDDRPVWTGSCPCQPFSQAGKGAGFDDERHLWPAFHWLIEQCRPATVFGEQVESKDGRTWLDLVQADLEAGGYALGAVAFPSAGIGAPHIRSRMFWVADANNRGPQGREQRGNGTVERASGSSGVVGGLADADSKRCDRIDAPVREGQERNAEAARGGSDGDDFCLECGRNWDYCVCPLPRLASVFNEPTGPTNGFWRAADWLFCRDGKFRPVEPGTFPLAHGATARVGRLRSYGNAICAPVARAFIESYLNHEKFIHKK